MVAMMGGTQVGKDLLKSSMQGWGRFRGESEGPTAGGEAGSLLPLICISDHLLLAMGPQGMVTHLWEAASLIQASKGFWGRK